jgi:hypothetical protein
MKRLTDEEMKRIAEDGSAAAMLVLWQEASRARESEARSHEREAELKAELRALGTALRDWGRNLVICGKTATHLGES